MTKAHILLIEDSPLQAKQTKNCLVKAGYLVTWAKTGLGGLKKALAVKPDLILLDLILPDKDGQEICLFIKLAEPTRGIPILMLTAKSKLADKVKGLNIGADDYLCKPFHEQELLARINAFLRIKSLQDELKTKNRELEELLKKVEIMAVTDAGTGLLNRRHFMELLEKEIARCKRFNTPLACLMMDIDHFKEVNDARGHLIGDVVLLEIGRVIQSGLRQIDIAARYGGDEFVILLPETLPAEAARPADRLLQSISDHRFNGIDPGRSFTASVGISGLPDPGVNTPQDLIRCSDYALYRAKDRGRNRIEVAAAAECPSFNVPLPG